MLRHLDLFSGLGGFSLGLEATGGFETVAFCDIEKFPLKVLKKHWPNVKQYKDIKELTYEQIKEDTLAPIDIITGGYPCQPFSIAGSQLGEKDKRHLWPDMFRIVKECKPTWVIGENVSGHIKLGLDTVLQDLESEGYSTRAFSISASSIGANHQRERVWVIGHADVEDTRQHVRGIESSWDTESLRPRTSEETEWTTNPDQINGSGQGASSMGETTNTHRKRLQGLWPELQLREDEKERSSSWERWWQFEPDVGRVANGVPQRVDRLKGLGNSLVPAIPYMIGHSILEEEL